MEKLGVHGTLEGRKRWCYTEIKRERKERMAVKVVIACDSFKGSVTAVQAVSYLEEGIRRVWPEAEVDGIPVADGGEGTVDAFLHSVPGRRIYVWVTGPLGEPVQAEFALLEDGTAVIEMAAASGLPLVSPEKRNPMLTTTYGTGELILAALNAGCARLVLGLGGSATNDGGAGMAQALGVKLLDGQGRSLPPGGGALERLERMDVNGIDPRLAQIPLVVACDVTNPLCGPQGASAVFGPQKGADGEMVAKLDQNLAHFARVGQACTGRDVVNVPGAGAAGGLGAGLLLFTNAQMCSGITTVLDTVGFDARVTDADLVITGEGRMDGQSVCGKTPVGVAQRVKAQGNIPVVAIVGSIGPQAERVYDYGIDAIFSTAPGPITLEEAMGNSHTLLASTAERVARLMRAVRP